MSDAGLAKKDSFTIACVVSITLAAVIAIVFMSARLVAEFEAKQSVYWQAVERGFAEWVPDKEGNTTFKWKEVAK